MKNILKAIRKAAPSTLTQSVSSQIKEIHDTFYTEVDRLLKEAKVMNSLETTKNDLIKKRNRLVALGFTQTKEVKEATDEILRLESLELDNKLKTELTEAIEYFSERYPTYRFITEESVMRICKKYNLIYGGVDKYIGTVPDKNLKHIEDFKIKDEDRCWSIVRSIRGYIDDSDIIASLEEINKMGSISTISDNLIYATDEYDCYRTKCDRMGLEIAAPEKDFDTKDMDIENFKLTKAHIPDPIVLMPVYFKKMKHYLIVTAWGDEAADENVINPINN